MDTHKSFAESAILRRIRNYGCGSLRRVEPLINRQAGNHQN
jgi:hypothetical protein